jgi:hypothetical protein
MLIEAIVRRFPALKSLSEATTAARLTGLLSLAVSQVEAERQEATRAGRRFRALGVAAGAAPVQAIPTTTATHALFNADPNRSYVVDSIDVMLLSGTATIGATVLAIVSPITATLPTAATGSLVQSSSAGGLQSKAVFATAYTIPTPAGNAQWGIASATSQPGGVPGVGGLFSCDVRGGIVVPPRYVLGIAVLAGAGTTPLYVPSVTWSEAELDLE